MEGELGSPTGKPCIFGTTPSLVVAYVLVMSVWYPVERDNFAERPTDTTNFDTKII